MPFLTILLLSALLAGDAFATPPTQLADPNYVGVETCASCHQEAFEAWQGSHHDLAMQEPTPDTVLGNFNDTTFTYGGVTSRFYRRGEDFMVSTDGPDGKLTDYRVEYVFGADPLQQYLLTLAGGRLQALSISWDSRPASSGGQRWFHLYPEDTITYEDELHWTRNVFNWNGMCAECHSTNLQKNYDSVKDSFQTSWSEIDVACEACHGPASNHLLWANKNSGWQDLAADKGLALGFDERKGVHWKVDVQTGSASRSQPRATVKEIDVCAQCHSRRSVISDDYSPGKPFLDHYMPRLLDEGMYHADGQMQDEVYVYGSFIQSKMFHKGVTCSDCHEPHSLELRQPGNGVCLQCHAAEKFDNKEHHFHPPGSAGASCAECHMPPTAYMVVDPRHDHSFRIPRPDQSVQLGTPNACNNCHQDKNNSWAAGQLAQWYGNDTEGFQKYAYALDAGRTGKAGAGRLLMAQISDIETPDIARASAISTIAPYLDQASFEVVQKGLQDDSAMVRTASLGAIEALPAGMMVKLAFPLLEDPVRSVRIEAARILAPVPVGQLEGEQLSIYLRAAEEYLDSQRVNADRPEAQLNLGNYYLAKAEYEKAISAYEQSITLEPRFIPAYINLADLYRSRQDDAGAEKVLRRAIAVAPGNADAYYSLALLQIRKEQSAQAVGLLQRASELDVTNARYVYVYAVALNSSGDNQQAIDVLQAAQQRFPQDRDILNALVAFHRDAGNDFAAEKWMKVLQKLNR